MRIAKFAAKSESPIVTNRDSGGRSPGFDGSGFGASVALVAVTAPMVTGPALSPLSTFNSTRPDLSCAMSVSAQLRSLVWMIGMAARPLDAGRISVIDRADGNAVITLNRSVIGCDGYFATTGTHASVPAICPI